MSFHVAPTFLLIVSIFSAGIAMSNERDDASAIPVAAEPTRGLHGPKERMDKAIAEAQSTLSQFIKALTDSQETCENFNVRKGFAHSGTSKEYIWVSNVSIVDGEFEGIISNEPVDAKYLKLGEKARVTKAEVVDWMYTDQGKLKGGYTIAAMVYGTPDQDQFAAAMQIDWNTYKFLTER